MAMIRQALEIAVHCLVHEARMPSASFLTLASRVCTASQEANTNGQADVQMSIMQAVNVDIGNARSG